MKRAMLLASVAAIVLTAGAVFAETCLSPYIKGLRQPEKVMYVWTLPADQGSDYLSVIDVNLASPTYGKILKKVEVGSIGNEAHHMGFTDDRTKIWAAALNTSRFFIFDVGTDPMNPRLIRTIDEVPRLTGLSGPQTPYAIPGRMLISMASGPDGTGPGGLAEFTNDGEFVASYRASNHPYETVVKPEFNRMITSAWVSQRTFMSSLDKWDPKDFSNTMLVWDLKARKIVQELKGDPIPLATRWALRPNATYGYNISNAGDSIWMFRMQKNGTFTYRKAGDTGKGCAPGDLRQSPDDRYLYVSCIARGEVQAWDISNPEKIRLHDTVQGIVQANMMHMTYDGRRLYVTNSAISSIDYSPRYALRLIYVGPDGRMKLDPDFRIDFAKAPDGPARPHDMLLN
ncbi:MAG TPA: selenium-binding protein SBP56-related protein [Methylomirabilota bacterium]|nr:selenium-binding protein SBP56-related protein [Methylomirabilota bacterium]